VNDDGSVTMPFLSWVDERNGTDNPDFYQERSWFPGLHPERDNMPLALAGPNECPAYPGARRAIPLFFERYEHVSNTVQGFVRGSMQQV
jgi:hypothetical protein